MDQAVAKLRPGHDVNSIRAGQILDQLTQRLIVEGDRIIVDKDNCADIIEIQCHQLRVQILRIQDVRDNLLVIFPNSGLPELISRFASPVRHADLGGKHRSEPGGGFCRSKRIQMCLALLIRFRVDDIFHIIHVQERDAVFVRNVLRAVCNPLQILIFRKGDLNQNGKNILLPAQIQNPSKISFADRSFLEFLRRIHPRIERYTGIHLIAELRAKNRLSAWLSKDSLIILPFQGGPAAVITDKIKGKLPSEGGIRNQIRQSSPLVFPVRKSIHHLVKLINCGTPVRVRFRVRHHIQILIVLLQKIRVNHHIFWRPVVERVHKFPVGHRQNIPMSAEIVGGNSKVLVQNRRIDPVDHVRGSKEQHIRLRSRGKIIPVFLPAVLSLHQAVRQIQTARKKDQKQRRKKHLLNFLSCFSNSHHSLPYVRTDCK